MTGDNTKIKIKQINKKYDSENKRRSRKRSRSPSSSSSSPDRKKSKKSKKVSSKKKHKYKSSTSSNSTSSDSTSNTDSEKKYKRKKLKKQFQKLKKLKGNEPKQKTKHEQKTSSEKECSNDIPISLMDKSKLRAPMTKEEWEKRQSIVRRVYDEETGRHRLIKGDGEVIEEIVSLKRHKEINKIATQGDGSYFQTKISSSLKK